jgi:hypothetical protein
MPRIRRQVNAHRILVGKCLGEWSFGSPRGKQEDGSEKEFMEISYVKWKMGGLI